ncbi:roadblock/LC7 domain-containing protein [Amycolatopsis taiwanensis]|uniref:Roadblock/LAMTOR2 domain-containing protein n=1 Tax=Amycolatopsis taiwanensis TaxID=342230 RepID=A0A9W6QY21_9PSEU|nr:roadblock/LC7 domain-containing protein [Amycolatopsis taiwanensis]GLY64876.1 hypothetical protein Atai01_14950 [Amycolatopsis taiwanensis]
MTDRVQYLLENLLAADGVPGLQMVIAVTSDGMLRGCAYRNSDAADPAEAERLRAEAERLAAGTATLMALAGALLNEQGDMLRQLPIEGRHCWYIVISAGQHAFLAARAHHNANLDSVFYGLNRIVGSVGQELAAVARGGAEPGRVPSGASEY